WLAIFPFWVFWFFTPPTVPWLMLGYALAVNLPCIVVQRYNRPRVKRFIDYRGRRETVTVTD
ncbi:MAG: glycosyl-4,4'-diaponeurosporenoate acyltransferase, partial [Candidatus Cryosericum sp.]